MTERPWQPPSGSAALPGTPSGPASAPGGAGGEPAPTYSVKGRNAAPHIAPPQLDSPHVDAKRGPWMNMANGRRFWILYPDPADVDPWSLAVQLSNKNRYNGAIDPPYSVGQHSNHVRRIARRLLPAAEPYGHLHDGEEFACGDQTRPVKDAITRLLAERLPPEIVERYGAAFFDAQAEILNRAARAVHLRFGLEWPPPAEIAAAVKLADNIALATEIRDLAPQGSYWGRGPERPDPYESLAPLPASVVRDQFMAALNAMAAVGTIRL